METNGFDKMIENCKTFSSTASKFVSHFPEGWQEASLLFLQKSSKSVLRAAHFARYEMYMSETDNNQLFRFRKTETYLKETLARFEKFEETLAGIVRKAVSENGGSTIISFPASLYAVLLTTEKKAKESAKRQLFAVQELIRQTAE